MISGRTLLIVAVAAAGWWLWRSGEWQTVAARLENLSEDVAATVSAASTATGASPATAPDATPGPASETASQSAPAANEIRTWVDAQGVRHFASAKLAPQKSAPHEPSPATILTDYDQPLREKQQATTGKTTDDKGQRSAPDATTAAYELMDNLEQRLEAIRQENNR